ncbi:unnamed protein product [Rotaria sp. Silwood2]|nr:unnamed protein product [Rotaria sp. Silwood2]
MTSLSITPNPSSIKTDDDDDDNTSNSVPSSSNSKLDIEQSETRSITISEAIGLDFNSFIPQADITSQVHFVSNIQLGSQVDLAGLKDGDRPFNGSSLIDSSDLTKSHRYEIFNIVKSDESIKEEPLKAKLCYLRKNLHVIGVVEEASPSYRAGLHENDVIIFVGKKNLEKLTHDDVKVMIRAMTLASNQVELTVLSKLHIPRYKKLQEKDLIDWSIMGL